MLIILPQSFGIKEFTLMRSTNKLPPGRNWFALSLPAAAFVLCLQPQYKTISYTFDISRE
jgi:hypothetical protein